MHQRMLSYAHRVDSPDDADLFWVSFYPTLSAIAHRGVSAEAREGVAANERAALRWLREHAPRFFTEPHRHVFALGKTAGEFFGSGTGLYGSCWLLWRELRNVNFLTIEADAGEQKICATAPHLRSYMAKNAFEQYLANKQHLTPEQLGHARALQIVLEAPDSAEAQRIEVCNGRTAFNVTRDSSARVWAVPYNSIYAYEPFPAESAKSEISAAFPWLVRARDSRPLLAAFVGAETRAKIGLYVSLRVAAVRSCRQWAVAVADRGTSAWHVNATGPAAEVETQSAVEARSAAAAPEYKTGYREGSCLVQPNTDRMSIGALYARSIFCLQVAYVIQLISLFVN
ncbi:hypothetical protein T492DRAFT_431039 [Pavlovales sp. CCMP2436]|nr:hypothetical protein T492DRAFT_431039 [Pavlovales sp. CCMP2436]